MHSTRITDREKSPQTKNNARLRSLMSFFERGQARFRLNTLVVIEMDVVINQRFGLNKCLWFRAIDTFGFEDGAEVLSHRVIVAVSAS